MAVRGKQIGNQINVPGASAAGAVWSTSADIQKVAVELSVLRAVGRVNWSSGVGKGGSKKFLDRIRLFQARMRRTCTYSVSDIELEVIVLGLKGE